jgi:hypothetical protein
MEKKSKTPAPKVNRRVISAVTLVIVLALTVVFLTLGVTGRNMDPQGLYKQLPWLPIPGEGTLWRDALVPGAALGDTQVKTLVPSEADASADGEKLKAAVPVIAKRLRDLGWTDAAVELTEGQVVVTLPKGVDDAFISRIISVKGEFTFADPQGAVFMTGERVKGAGFSNADRTGTNYALTLEFDAEGKEIFGKKSLELMGQSISVLKDGEVLASPTISTPLVEGAVSIPGFTFESARENAVLLRSGALPFSMTVQATEQGPAMLGRNAQNMLIITLLGFFLAVALYLVFRFRLGGLFAAWMLLLQLALSYFFAALIGAGYTVLTLAAIYVPLLVSIFAVLNLFGSVRDDLRRGRSFRQALKEGYAGKGHASLDVYAGLIVLFVILIIMDKGIIKTFSEVFAISLLLGLTAIHLALRLLLVEGSILFGSKTALYSSDKPAKREG